MTYEALEKVNKELKTVDIKGKAYVEVNERVKAFRKLFPDGSITTEIISLADGVVTMRAIVSDGEGSLLATGLAQEKESSSFINKTSYIENAETSAVGRALGFCGIGIDGEIASADEQQNANINQERFEYINKTEQKVLINMIQKRGLNVENVLNGTPIEKVTAEAYADAVKKLEKLPEVNS